MISEGDHVKFARFLLLAVSEKERKNDFPCFSGLMHNKTIIRYGFCDIHSNKGLSKDCQPEASSKFIRM